MFVIRCDPRFSHGPWILRFLCSQLLVLYISGSNRYISLRGGKRRAQKRAKARDTQHHKILGSRTKESPIPSVATPWSRGPPSAESYCLIHVATGGIGDPFILLPRILWCWCWCWVSFARAFLLAPREASNTGSNENESHESCDIMMRE